MIHIRNDKKDVNGNRTFVCGIGPELPNGDKWVGDCEYGLHGMVDCPDCNPAPIGWSAMNGNAANRFADPDGWARWVAFCDANGAP